jgi:hypothetical protein
MSDQNANHGIAKSPQARIGLHEIYYLYGNPRLHFLRRTVSALTGCYYWTDIQEAIAASQTLRAALGRLCECTIPSECRKNGILFIHVPRCGGMSISTAIYGHFRDHHSASYFKNIDHEFFSAAFKFALVRDPILRALSAYKFILKKGATDMALDRGWQIKTKHIKTIDHYIGFLEENSSRLHQLDFIMRPQGHFILDSNGKLLVNKLFRMESDMAALSSLIRSWGLANIPRINATPAMRLELNHRQTDRLAALYADDVRLYEGDFVGLAA